MPEDVKAALVQREVLEDYEARPYYQRNDYLSWISRAKRPETRRKRLQQMLDELERGGVYMGMDHRPSRKD
jgi:uncharacterized protein YdeI (YjbR/CyaY-like superfamily)